MITLPSLRDKDPADLGFPPMLPIELAARTGRPSEICSSYGLSRDDFDKIKTNPLFLAALKEAQRIMSEDGASFKLKAKSIAELYLKKMWELTEGDDFDKVPANVRADVMKFTIRAAGLDGSIEQKAAAGAAAIGKATGNALNIQINLAGLNHASDRGGAVISG